MPKKNYVSGFGEKDPDIHEFLKPDNTAPFSQGGPSGEGYHGRRFDDATGVERGAVGFASSEDDAAFLKASWTGDYGDKPHERLASLIDNEAGQPAGKMLGGGGPVSRNKVGSVGSGPPRYKVKTGPQGNLRKPR